MNLGIGFLIIGAIFVISEIFSFTFYLIAIGIAFFIGAAFLLNGYSTNFSLYATGISIVVGIFVAHYVRKKLNNPESDKVSQDDTGNSVTIESMSGADARVSYRGTQWNGRLHDLKDENYNPGDKLYIVRREGNLLILSGDKPEQ
jgi:membrane protein implicated in regulation of membrane protease activity